MGKLKKLLPSSVGFIVKRKNLEARQVALDLAMLCKKRGVQAIFANEDKHWLRQEDRLHKTVLKSKMSASCDLIVVLGGDGTLLSIARLMKSKSVPILGINMGQLGFLTETRKDEAFGVLLDLLKGKKPLVRTRALLEVSLRRDGKKIYQGPVVNDVVISKGAIARIIGLEVWINGKWVHNIRADGLIVATPTGSTAYSLAAGGPIVDPALNAFVLTPICPHSLTHRPIVVPDNSEIQIHLKQRPGHVLLTLDGQDAVDLKEGDAVWISVYKNHPLYLIGSPGRDYYGLLREKFKLGMRD